MGEERVKNEGLRGRFIRSLGKTRLKVPHGIGNLVLGEKRIDEDTLLDLEASLLTTDVGVDAAEAIIAGLKGRLSRNELSDRKSLHQALQAELTEMARPLGKPFQIGSARPFVVLFIGVNGVGKTTTIGKLSKHLESAGFSTLLAAGDTFRAAATEQIQAWGASNDVPVVSQQSGADSAAVIYDAIETAKRQGIDVVLADTAGRLQAKKGLMDELSKIKRVIARTDETAPHECLLVVDANVGQNAISQLYDFDEAVGVSGMVVAKLDGSARGGVLFSLAHAQASKECTPVYFVGLGESADDLEPFDPDAFVEALLAP